MQSAMKENFDLQATYLETLLKYRWYVPGVLVVALIQPCTWKGCTPSSAPANTCM